MPVKEPRWITGCMGSFGIKLAPFAKVTRAQWRRAIKEARREALLSAAEECRECATKTRVAADEIADRTMFQQAMSDADHWDETALWLEKRAEAKASA